MNFYTIKEIAKMAGVSTGTVDRVLHKRGKVSFEKESRVNEILKKIDYRPNEVARSLKLNRKFRLVVLMPDGTLDEYWEPCFEAIEELKKSLPEKGIFVEVFKYDPTDPTNFKDISLKSISIHPDGVLLGALFQKESKKFLDQLEEKSIPFVLFNALVENTDFQSFVGQDLHQSGRTVAHLFDSILPPKKSMLVVHLAEEFENALHMQQKEEGFRSYFKNQEAVKIKTINIKAGQDSLTKQIKEGKIHEPIDGIFVTTSKAHLLVDADLNVPIIGYDLLKENIDYLRNGEIRFIIYQNPKMQAHLGLNLLTDALIKPNQSPKQQYLPIEIISKENLDSFL